jgi:hypothetical protein
MARPQRGRKVYAKAKGTRNERTGESHVAMRPRMIFGSLIGRLVEQAFEPGPEGYRRLEETAGYTAPVAGESGRLVSPPG